MRYSTKSSKVVLITILLLLTAVCIGCDNASDAPTKKTTQAGITLSRSKPSECYDTSYWTSELTDFVNRMNNGGFTYTELHIPERPDQVIHPASKFRKELESEYQNKVAPWIEISFPWPEGQDYTDDDDSKI